MDSPEYQEKKKRFARLLTIYGRNPVMEALEHPQVQPVRLHLADSNQRNAQITAMENLAHKRGAEVLYHDRQALARISKNGKQDQGVALDIATPGYRPLESFLEEQPRHAPQLLALDRVTNPQNVGMIIRSLAASGIDGLLLPRKGCAQPEDALVLKASAGTLFHCPLLRCETLHKGLAALKQAGYRLLTLRMDGQNDLFSLDTRQPTVYILGNESEGVSADTQALADGGVSIPMAAGVESLNVAVTAALLAYQLGHQGGYLPRR